MSVRLAVADDRAFFLRSWHSYLVDMAEKGSEILPTARTVMFYGDLFDAYVSGDREGIAAISYPIGVAMAGDCTPGYDSRYGKTAIGWGTYVRPEFRGLGHAATLREFTCARLRDFGFDTLLGSILIGDAAADNSIRRVPDVEVKQTVYAKRLR